MLPRSIRWESYCREKSLQAFAQTLLRQRGTSPLFSADSRQRRRRSSHRINRQTSAIDTIVFRFTVGAKVTCTCHGKANVVWRTLCPNAIFLSFTAAYRNVHKSHVNLDEESTALSGVRKVEQSQKMMRNKQFSHRYTLVAIYALAVATLTIARSAATAAAAASSGTT